MIDDRNKPIYVAGHRGMVGSALVRQLQQQGYRNIITRTRQELELTDQRAVNEFFASNDIAEVYVAAARVGGIHANNAYPAEFIYENLMVQCNVINAAHMAGVERLMFLGSSCIYPRDAKQPMAEESLLTGKLETTNEPYAVAKIAGLKLCESFNRQYGRDYRAVMPTNLYGPGDNFHPQNGHVIPSMMQRFHYAKTEQRPDVIVWGSGRPMREFLFVDDMARACIHVMSLTRQEYTAQTEPQLSHLNVGYGSDVTIAQLARAMAEVVGFEGRLSLTRRSLMVRRGS